MTGWETVDHHFFTDRKAAEDHQKALERHMSLEEFVREHAWRDMPEQALVRVLEENREQLLAILA